MKNIQAIILLFIANSVSGIAQGISMIAIPWYFQQLDMIPTHGWVYLVTNFVSFIWVPYGGTLVDRFNRKHVFLTLNIVLTVIVGLVALYGFYFDHLPWYLVSLIFMTTFLNYNLHYPNLYAFIQEITSENYYEKITSYLEIQGQLSRVLAGACGALLLEGTVNGKLNVFGFYIELGKDIEPWTIYEIFMLDAATYLVSFFLILAIRFVPLKKRHHEKGDFFDRLKIGWNFLTNHRSIFTFGLASYGIFISLLLTTYYLNALYVDKHLEMGADVYAAEIMYYAIGAVFAGLTVRYLMKAMNISSIIILFTLIIAGRFVYLTFNTSVLIYYILAVLLGVANAATRITRVNYLFRTVPNQVIGRTGSIFFMGNIIFRNSFILLFNLPFFVRDDNVRWAFMITGIFLFICAVVLALNKKEIDAVPKAQLQS